MAEHSKDPVGDAELDSLGWGSLRDWTELVRLPAAFTLVSNVMAATVLSGQLFRPMTAFLPVLLASLAAYWAGMILNDVVDIEEDREARRRRPLVEGRISPVIAGHVATALLMLCPISILGVTSLHPSQSLWQGLAFACSVLLVLCVRGYNSFLKATPLGALLMGSCRGLNIVMVGTTLFSLGEETAFPMPLIYFAAAIGVYILGVTIFAGKEEQEDSDSGMLLLGLALQVGGMALIAFLTRAESREIRWSLAPSTYFPLLLGLIAMTVINRSFKAILQPASRKVQLAVKHSLLTLILLDAAVAMMWAGPIYGCLVVSLLVPALVSAIRFRTT